MDFVKQLKRWISTLLMLCLCLSIVPIQAKAATYATYTGVDFQNASISAQRKAALTKAMQMVTVKWTCPADFPTWRSSGGILNTVVATDGTSSNKFIKGKTYTGIPYSMADHTYDDIAWANAISSGKITTSYMTGSYYGNGSTTAHGSDCSYFVYLALKAANAGNISYQTTATMLNSSYYKKINWSELKPADLFLKNGHVMMFVGMSGSNYAVFESDAGDSKCSYNVYTKSQLSSYSCYRYTNFNDTAASAPTVANLSINSIHCKIGQEFTFSLSSDVSCTYYISIVDADTGEYVVHGEQTSSTYRNSFQRAGHYSAWMTAANSNGSKDSNFVDFWVFGSPPTSASFSTNKTTMELGDTVTLTTTSNAYYVRIAIAIFLYNDANNGTQVCSGEVPYTYNYKPTQNGMYTGYVTAWTHEGEVDSNWVTFHVGKYTVNYNANGGSGAPSSQTKYYGKDISLSTTKPTRTNYNFLGWSTSANASTAEYQPGSTFARNANTTLYAVWKHICATGHSYSYKVTKSPTTSATGTLTGTCSKCSGTTTITLPKLDTTNYTYKVTKEPTCTASGTGRYTWKTATYGTFYFDVSIAAKGHTYTSKITAPTCTQQGYTTYTCACGHTYKDNYTAATGHSYSYKVTKNPTTSATGTLTGTCSKCSGTTTVTLPKLDTTNYTYNVTKAATCTASGTGRYTWKTTTYGSFYFDVTIAAKGHSYTSKVTAPTCTQQGYTTYTCTCGHTYKDNYTSATGHSYHYRVFESPTTSVTGTLVGNCSKCSEAAIITLPKLNRSDYTYAVIQEPTCTEMGIARYTWKVVTYGIYYFDISLASYHSLTEWLVIKVPTPYEEGIMVRSCMRCDYSEQRTIPKTGNPFTDVPAGCWYEAPVLWALENGITTGTSDTTFSPGDKCLRAHVVTFLWNAEKTPEPTAYTKSFSDVPAGAWYYKPVHWAVEHGITSGVSDTKFGAGDVCSRYQVVFFLWKAAGSPEPKTTVNPFTDVNPGHFFYKAVLWAVENGITSGTSATTFGPTAPCNRAQVVTFLNAAYN